MPIDGVRLSDKTCNPLLPGERLRPLRDQIVIRPLPVELSETLIAEWRGEVVRGQVVAVGPGVYPNVHQKSKRDGRDVRTVRPLKAFRPTDVKVGDIVDIGGMEIGGYLFTHVQIEGVDHVICREQDVTWVSDGD